MHPTWQRLDHLFEHALALAADDRQAFLADVERQHPDLYPRLCSLLESDQATTGFLDNHAPDLVATLLSDPPEPEDHPINSTIGPYTIIRELGQGGMGVVYLAQRTHDGFAQSVALKVLKRGLDTHAVVQRFRQERAVLAALEHPNIARILDGGTTPDGRPYFAMEYIDGQPITTYCDNRQARIEERLALFETVCEAVQYAHQNLVVHRDLKPSNILVTADGTVKLLDFGIAKVLGERPYSFSLIETVPAERLLTPAYASPEQLRGEVISTASDVYALGVLLYELLVGLRPFQPLARQAVEHILDNHEIVRPSKALTALLRTKETDDETTWLVETRQTSFERLRRRLAGDLDVICLKALHQEVDRRYGTAGALGADIRRHLGGMPVEAQPDSYHYRLRKFARRHRGTLALVGVFVLTLIMVVASYTWRQAKLVNELVAEAEKTQAVQGFLIDMFAAADPTQTAERDSMYVRDFLDEGARRIATSLTDQPLAKAELMQTLGDVYLTLGLFAQADTLIGEAQRLRERLLPPTDDAVQTGWLNMARLRVEQSRYLEADSLYRLALAAFDSIRQPLHYAYALHGLGSIEIERVNFAEAEGFMQRALATHKAHVPLDTVRYMGVVESLAVLYGFQRRYDEARTHYEEAIALARHVHGDAHLTTASYLHNWGTELLARGAFAEAEQLLTEVLHIEQQILGRDHLDVANTLSNLAKAAHSQGSYAQAESLYTEARGINTDVYSAAHETVGFISLMLGLIYCEQGQEEAARQAFRDAEDGLRTAEIGEMFIGLLRGLESSCALQRGSVEEAIALAEQTTPLLEADEDFILLQPYAASALGAVRMRQGRYVEAENLLVQAYENMRLAPGFIPNQLGYTRHHLIDLYQATGRVDEAEALHDEALGH